MPAANRSIMQECHLTVMWVGPLFGLVPSSATPNFGPHLSINDRSNVGCTPPLLYLLCKTKKACNASADRLDALKKNT